MRLGIEKTAMIRVRASIGYALAEAMDEGHCGLPSEELVPLAEELLEVEGGIVRTALELADGNVVADKVGETPCIFLAGLHRAERVIAERLLCVAAGRLPWPAIDPALALPWIEAKTGLALAPSQAEAIRLALVSKVLVVTGGPGVGKTTIVNSILRILAAKGTTLLLCAPTGRAAKRMTEATGFEAKTIHRLLELDPKTGGFKRNQEKPLDCGLLVVDETSMVDVLLMRALLEAVPDRAALLIVGDIDQLPSVGPGQVLADIIASVAPGDKVMQIENDYDKEVYNGDIGYIDNVDPDAGELTASFDGRAVTFGFGELDTLVPAYAVTIHKSQGSEYPAVVIPLMTQHYAMLQRNLLYTGVTRGKRLVVLVGQKKAVAIAVKNVAGRRRWSKLREWMGRPRVGLTEAGPVAHLRISIRAEGKL